MCRFGRLSHLLETKGRRDIISFLQSAKQLNKRPIFQVFQAPTKLMAASFEFSGNETITKYLTMVRKGRLIITSSAEDDTEILNIHFSKIDTDDVDIPLSILKKDVDLFLYTLE
jgi:hypothetical protein